MDKMLHWPQFFTVPSLNQDNPGKYLAALFDYPVPRQKMCILFHAQFKLGRKFSIQVKTVDACCHSAAEWGFAMTANQSHAMLGNPV